MGIFPGDLIIKTALQAALADIRRNQFLIDDLASQVVSDPLTKALYGDAYVDKVKKFLKYQIDVVMADRLDTAKFPCISIAIGSGSEDSGREALGDSYGSESVDAATLGGAVLDSPAIIIGPVTPNSYDSVTGKIVFDSSVNLSNVFDGYIVFDEINQKGYPIVLAQDVSTIFIEANSKPNLTGMTIRPTTNQVSHIRRSLWHYENYDLEVFAVEQADALYLWQLVMYMLIRYKKPFFDARGFSISTANYGPMERGVLGESNPNTLFSRKITLRGRVEHSAIEQTNLPIGGINMDLILCDLKTPDALLPDVEKQGWKGDQDP